MVSFLVMTACNTRSGKLLCIYINKLIRSSALHKHEEGNDTPHFQRGPGTHFCSWPKSASMMPWSPVRNGARLRSL